MFWVFIIRLLSSMPLRKNGSVESTLRKVVVRGISLLVQGAVPIRYYTYAFETIVYFKNRTTNHILQYMLPYEYMYAWVPNYHLLKIFGCQAFPCHRIYAKHKFICMCVFWLRISTQGLYVLWLSIWEDYC